MRTPPQQQQDVPSARPSGRPARAKIHLHRIAIEQDEGKEVGKIKGAKEGGALCLPVKQATHRGWSALGVHDAHACKAEAPGHYSRGQGEEVEQCSATRKEGRRVLGSPAS